MSIVIVQKGDPTNPNIGNRWFANESDDIVTVITDNYAELDNGDIVIHIINPNSLVTGGEVNAYIVDTESNDARYAPLGIVLRDNANIQAYVDLCDVGDVRATAKAPVELETFTVFGLNDDDEPFTAVITADPGKVEEAARQAGASSPEYTNLVDVVSILKGDQTENKVA